jgi:hypothetical protein
MKKVHKQLENIRGEEQYENAEPNRIRREKQYAEQNRDPGVCMLRAGYRIGISQ